MKVLITGIAGVLGRLVAQLQQELGHEVFGIDRRPWPDAPILETGLWSAPAGLLWDTERRLAEKQGAEIRILAPDEPEVRASFEAGHPQKVRSRESLLVNLVPPAGLFDDDETDADGDNDALDDAEDGEEDEP